MIVIKISKKCRYIAIFIVAICIMAIFSSKYNNTTTEETKTVSTNIEKKIIQENTKVAYLTFDDGPTKKETEKILNILKEEKVKATFFVVGKHVKEYPEIVKREYEEGHYIANHGYSHDNNKLYKSKESFIAEIKDTDKEIGEAIAVSDYCSHIFRFPNGYMSKIYKSQKEKAVKLLDEIDYYYIDWNCLNKDSETKLSKFELLENLKKSSRNKSTLIILMHDTGDVNNTSEVLKESIDYLKSNGYEFRNMYDVTRVRNKKGLI